jgi:DNA-binding response OmpR family regulator
LNGKRIIITDDDTAIQDAVAILLGREGYDVTSFSSGEALLKGEFEIPHLFILDKQLPNMDGLEICRHLKEQESTKHIPVLILSASPHIGEQVKDSCADDFLEKPFSIRALREKVETLLRNA